MWVHLQIIRAEAHLYSHLILAGKRDVGRSWKLALQAATVRYITPAVISTPTKPVPDLINVFLVVVSIPSPLANDETKLQVGSEAAHLSA